MKVPRPNQMWECPKCGNHGTNYMIRYDDRRYQQPGLELMNLCCNRCGYTEQRAPMDAEDA